VSACALSDLVYSADAESSDGDRASGWGTWVDGQWVPYDPTTADWNTPLHPDEPSWWLDVEILRAHSRGLGLES
jgi:hypothetical protein